MAGHEKNKAAVMPEISGRVLQAARQKLKISPEDLGAKACLSKKHIIQLEEGGVSSFYSEAHKITVAKKVGKLLNLEESQFLVYPDSHQSLQNSLPFDVEPEASSEASPKEPILGKNDMIGSAPVTPVADSVVSGGSKQEIRLETPWLTKERFAGGVQFRLPANLLKWGLLLLVVAGLYMTKDDVVELFSGNSPVPVMAAPAEQTATESSPAQNDSSSTVTAANSPIVNPPLPSEEGCPKPDASMVEYRVTEATKPADFVFVQSKAKQVICVVDASGKSNRQSLDVGASYTFMGKAPFTLLTNNLAQLSIYFQGRPVRVQGDQAHSIKLQEVKFSQ
jgi:transcriptional regulator with XRE-family HTH domain